MRPPHRSRPPLALAPLAAALLCACAPTFPKPTAASVTALSARDPDVKLADLEHGRSLYLGKCGSCHALVEPTSVPPDAWPAKVRRMQGEGRVHLAQSDITDIERYLVAVSLVAKR